MASFDDRAIDNLMSAVGREVELSDSELAYQDERFLFWLANDLRAGLDRESHHDRIDQPRDRGRQRDTAQPGPHRCPVVPRAGNLSLMAVDFAAGNWVTPPNVHARLRRGWRRSEASGVVSEHWRATAPSAIRRWS